MTARPVALVTGSSRGIGLGIAFELAKRGFAIALNGPVMDAELQSAVACVADIGGPVIAVPFDVSDLGHHDDALDTIETTLGPLTTLVNNAGVGVMQRGDPLDVTPESFDRCMAINARAVFFLTQRFARRILGRPRNPELFHSIVTVTSSNAVAVAVPRSEYCASKAAASMITKTFAVRLGGDNIHVYDIQPGLIETDMTAPVIAQYKQRAKDGLTILPNVGQPRDVGRVAAALVCGDLPYTTGHVISVDAGMLVPRY